MSNDKISSTVPIWTGGGGGEVTLSGEVTGTGPSGGVVTTIANAVVTNAKLSDVATQTFKGRATGGTGSPEDLTSAQATALLNPLTSGANNPGLQGLVPAPLLGDIAKFLRGDGTWAVVVAGITALTGEVTASGAGSVVATITNLAVTAAKIATNTITNNKLAQVATATFKGRITGGTGDVQDLTAANATSMLNAFTSGANNPGIKGLVPGPTLAQVAMFLRGDGTWAAAGGSAPLGGTTAARPVTPPQYTMYFDTTLVLPIWYVSPLWYDAAGVNV